jgi:hypothetical protein
MLKSKLTRINEFHGPVIPEPIQEANKSLQVISEALKEMAAAKEAAVEKENSQVFNLFRFKKFTCK